MPVVSVSNAIRLAAVQRGQQLFVIGIAGDQMRDSMADVGGFGAADGAGASAGQAHAELTGSPALWRGVARGAGWQAFDQAFKAQLAKERWRPASGRNVASQAAQSTSSGTSVRMVTSVLLRYALSLPASSAVLARAFA